MINTRLLRNTSFVIPALFFISVATRLITLEYIDIGGDNSIRWAYSSSLAYGVDGLELIHHTSRWIITLPLWGILEIFGIQPTLYYVLPILAASVGTIFIYLIGIQVRDEKLGLLAASVTILFPQMCQSGSHLWPSIFQFAFISMAIWSILCWDDHEHNGFIFFAALSFFLAWSARLTAVYFFPGLVALIILLSGRLTVAIRFTMTVGLLCLGEWVIFWLITGNPLGRIGIVTQSAIARHETLSITDYLFRFIEFKKLRGLIPVLILTIIASVIKLKNRDVRLKGIAILYLVYIFLLVYMVGSLFPIKPATWPSSRFWLAAAPFGLLLLCDALLDLKKKSPRTAGTLIVILIIAFTAFSIKKIPQVNSIKQIAANHAIIAPVLKAKTPILLEWTPWRPNFIEGQLYSLFGVEKKAKGVSADHVQMAMTREKNRIILVFLEDKSQIEPYLDGELLQVDKMKYLYIPPGSPHNTPHGAVIRFDRRESHAEKVETAN